MSSYLAKQYPEMSEEARIEKHNSMMMEEARLAHADVLEVDDGVIVGYGSDADYDSHAVDVMNGNGYYDENGHYVSFPYFDCYGEPIC